MQITRQVFRSLANQEKGLIGEHMVDYHELKRLGGNWPHDKEHGSFSPHEVRKLNVDKRPVNLALHDLPKVNHAGIDAVWLRGGSYTVTEANARESVFLLEGTAAKYGNATSKKLSKDLQSLYFLLHDSSDKRGGAAQAMVQMSREWVRSRAPREDMDRGTKAAVERRAYDRRVVLVTFESSGAVDHVQALADIHMGKAEAEVHAHTEHGASKVWTAADIDKVAEARAEAYREKHAGRPQATREDAEPKTDRKSRPPRGKK